MSESKSMTNLKVMVTIDSHEIGGLRLWVEQRGGQAEAWNKVVGTHGQLDRDSDAAELVSYARLEVALYQPDMRCPPHYEVPKAVLEDLLRMAADSYEWIHEGRFDAVDRPDVLEALKPALVARGEGTVEDGEQRIVYLRKHQGDEAIPDWEACSPGQRALIQEAFDADQRWQSEGRLNSQTRDAVIERLSRGTAD